MKTHLDRRFSRKRACCEFPKWFSYYIRLIVVGLSLSGFTYQTVMFLHLYWEYPTVVDIQRESPAFLDVPSITICNPNGINFTHLCYGLENISLCLNPKLSRHAKDFYCPKYPALCERGKLPKDFSSVLYSGMNKRTPFLSQETLGKLRQPLEEYVTCEILYAGEVTKCDLETVVSTFYSTAELPQFCLAIYSLWGKPNQTRSQIPRGSIMKFQFNLNATRRPENGPSLPTYNLMVNPSVQIAIHSPYYLPSPYFEGSNFLGGRSYELRLSLEEKDLLPAPYQTNCTDFMKMWRERGGIGPVDPLGIVLECMANSYNELYGCVPKDVDYPHDYPVCGKYITEDCKCKHEINETECLSLDSVYSQPCESIKYIVEKEEVNVEIKDNLTGQNMELNEVRSSGSKGHDCTGNRMWTKECSKIQVEILFDRYEVTRLKYNPKFESLELFSVLGGYMGMWLGISLITIYDIIGDSIGKFNSWFKKRHNKVHGKSKKMYFSPSVAKDPYYGMW